MVIRTATLQITVKDVSATLMRCRAWPGQAAGYVTQTENDQDGEDTVATITIQVPAKEFDGVVSQLRKIGVKPVQESITSSDVTEEYTDLQSQLRNMQATEQRVLALMTKAEKIDDILTLDRELRQVRGDIEQAQGRINYLSKRSELSTITVSLYPNSAPLPLASTANSLEPRRDRLYRLERVARYAGGRGQSSDYRSPSFCMVGCPPPACDLVSNPPQETRCSRFEHHLNRSSMITSHIAYSPR